MTQIEPRIIEFAVENPGERLDKLLVQAIPDQTRTQLQTLIKDGQASVNGKPAKAGEKLRVGDAIRIVIPAPPPSELTPEPMDLDILYEDLDIAVINKPAGLIVHPGAGAKTGTLAHGLLARFPELALMKGQRRQGIVHRLDQGTSGVLVIARTNGALENLMQQFQARTVGKIYMALLESPPSPREGRIDLPIGRDPQKRTRMAAIRTGRPAITEYETIESGLRGDQALVRIRLLTGRTHQIRVHFAKIGAPVVGDTTYGFLKQRVKLRRLFLHAAELSFNHPRTGERMTFSAPMPGNLQKLLASLRLTSPE